MARRPNILLILTDQHSPRAASFAGCRAVETPALDRLAARSVCFDAAYCQAPLCVPSRMSLLTGKHVHRCSGWDNSSVISPDHTTLPAWLAQHGYLTSAVGKMHFRGTEQMHGFAHRPFGDLVESRFPAHQPDPPETADGRWNNHAVGRFPFAGPSRIADNLLIDAIVTRESLAWLATNADSAPWFLVASYSRPHFPLTAPERYIRKYLDRGVELPPLPSGYPESLHPHDRFIVDDFGLLGFTREEQRLALGAYYACVEYVDDCIGELLDSLASQGRLDDTYIVYTSDHGELAGEHGLWWKRSYYEASARVPLLVSGPSVPEGERRSAVVELCDLFATVCDLAGVSTPNGLGSETLLSLFSPGRVSRWKRTARSELLGGDPRTRFRMVRRGCWKAVAFPDARPRLFNLDADPGETVDLAATPPADAPFEELLAELAKGGTWTALEERRLADRARVGPHRALSRGSVQYRLADGSLAEADAHLYPAP